MLRLGDQPGVRREPWRSGAQQHTYTDRVVDATRIARTLAASLPGRQPHFPSLQ